MPRFPHSHSPSPEDVAAHYASGCESDRLRIGPGQLDGMRTRELLERFLPPTPARIFDIGGGPGGHGCWLARIGYEVHLVDLVPLHVEQAKAASARQPETPLARTEVEDACALSASDGTADAVLLFGPLYHLTDRRDRLRALTEAHRVLRRGGVILAVGISRFASALDGVRAGFLKDPAFAEIVDGDLKDGHHLNPTNNPEYFMDTFFHHPNELKEELAEAGFSVEGVHGVEGPSWLVPDFDDWWQDLDLRNRMLQIARTLETEPALLGVSAHLVAVGSKD